MKAIYPPVHRSDPDWRDYYGMLNTPHHYHNGGVAFHRRLLRGGAPTGGRFGEGGLHARKAQCSERDRPIQ
jgi:hypothetical protein